MPWLRYKSSHHTLLFCGADDGQAETSAPTCNKKTSCDTAHVPRMCVFSARQSSACWNRLRAPVPWILFFELHLIRYFDRSLQASVTTVFSDDAWLTTKDRGLARATCPVLVIGWKIKARNWREDVNGISEYTLFADIFWFFGWRYVALVAVLCSSALQTRSRCLFMDSFDKFAIQYENEVVRAATN